MVKSDNGLKWSLISSTLVSLVKWLDSIVKKKKKCYKIVSMNRLSHFDLHYQYLYKTLMIISTSIDVFTLSGLVPEHQYFTTSFLGDDQYLNFRSTDLICFPYHKPHNLTLCSYHSLSSLAFFKLLYSIWIFTYIVKSVCFFCIL